MVAKYFVILVLIRLSSQVDWKCPSGPIQPQLSKAFLDGFWYEQFNTNDYLNGDPCSHFQITCNDSSSCEILHVKWNSYILRQLYNGTIKQEDNGVVLAISENSTYTKTYDINIRFDEKAVLIWKCNDTFGNTTDFFASLLMRMETQEDMQAVWIQSECDTKFPRILEGFPAGIWKKNNATECSGAAKMPNTFINSFLLATLIVTATFINM